MSGLRLAFDVPAASRAAVLSEFASRPASVQRRVCTAQWFDTTDRRLARKGLGWHLRREGRQWLQALAGPHAEPWDAAEQRVTLAAGTPDAALHAGTPEGARLLAQCAKAQAAGQPPQAWMQAEWRRLERRVRSRGALVELAFDTVRLSAGGRSQRCWRLQFVLLSGPPAAACALAERWRARFGLTIDPATLVERGRLLERGESVDRPRHARAPGYPPGLDAPDVLGAVVDECLDQVLRNAVAAAGAPATQASEHVHQLRVGVRRLRSGLRTFEGWAPAAPEPLVSGLRALFATLGELREDEVLGSGVAAALQAVGAPPLAAPAAAAPADLRQILHDAKVQQLLLAWVSWRHVALAVDAPPQAASEPAGDDETAQDGAAPLAARARRRLQRWQRRIEAEVRQFAGLDDTALHTLRKRIKRQRYAVEFLAPLLRPRDVRRYLGLLAAAQQGLGELNDLFTARARYQAQVQAQPAAWFALGWLAARIAACRGACEPPLVRLAAARVPGLAA